MGSAFSKVMLEIQSQIQTGGKKVQGFAKVAGMSTKEFSEAFKKDATSALIAFIEGLGKLDNKAVVLDELGLSELRVRDALLRASGAGDLFAKSIQIGSEAWRENTALANEANQRYATTESQIKILKNEIVGMAREIGVQLLPVVKDGLVVVKDLIEKFNALSPSTKENIIKFAALAAVTGPVIGGIGNVAQGLGSVMSIAGKVSTALGGASAAASAAGTASTVAAGTAGAGGLAGLASGLGGVVVAAAPYVLAGAAIAGAGYMVYKGLTEEVVPAVDLFADKIETTASTVTDEYGNMTASIETNTIKISEATKTAVGAYIKMDDDATNTLTNLYVNSAQITQDTVASLTTKYTEMGNQIKAGIDKRYNEMYSTMDTFFKNGAALTESEEKLALTSLQTNNNAKKIEVDRYTKEIQDILNNASKNNRALTLEEQQQINSIQEKMRVNAVNTLSETEVESKVILERLKNYSTRITAEQAAEIIKNANNTRDKAVQAANTQYDKTVASIIKMRDETKSITSDQADKLIKEAARQRDEAVNKAEELRSGVVNKLKQMNPDVEKEVNMQTGKIMTAWDKVKNWWNNLWFSKKTMEVQTKYTSSGQMNSLYKQYSGGIPMNALGTNYFQGGLTYLNEKGYEVYELPRGTKIYNHEASEQYVQKATEQLVSGLLEKFNGGGTQVNIYSPTPLSPSETARQFKKAQQELALNM